MTYRVWVEFHGLTDNSGDLVQTAKGRRVITYQDRRLTYRFFPHFHPYPAELIKRLIEGSVAELQAADTEYGKDDTGRPLPLPESTRVKMDDGRRLTLPDGKEIQFEDGTQVTLPSAEVLYREGTSLVLLDNIEVPLPDGTTAAYPSGTGATLIGAGRKPTLYEELFANSQYEPSELVADPHPVKDLDFTAGGAYAVYNWELFYHVPMTIAIHLGKNQRFEEAQRWFHFVFDPTDDSDGPTPERFWRVRPFQYTDVKLIEEILVNLATSEDTELRDATVKCIDAWKNAPFRPHLVARYRQTPYMFKAVTAYLDNLIAWGDSLFREDTRESINEATQLYVLAANILGPRPQAVPKKGSIRPQTYANLKKDLKEFGSVVREIEAELPFDLGPYPGEVAEIERHGVLRSMGHALYFCVPRNDRLLAYWDTVADRLFKIRNSLNILGVFRQLPLFEPPIDPALLAKAAASGLDVGAVVSGVNQPLPLVRFQFLVNKAAEICQEVKSLGSGLLSAIEREDHEALAMLRAKHERVILQLAETVKESQLEEAAKALEGLEKALEIASQRYAYYERLLGREEDWFPSSGGDALTSVDTVEAGVKDSRPRQIEVDIAQNVVGFASGRKISTSEATELANLDLAHGWRKSAAGLDLIGSALSLIPQFESNAEPVGVGVSTGFGGVQLSKMTSMMSSLMRMRSEQKLHEAQQNARVGSFARREQEWAFQSNLALGEIRQILKQIDAALIRETIAEKELENQQEQIKKAEEMERFLSGEEVLIGEKGHRKTGTRGFYAWMKREVKGLYGECFQLAFEVARKAERALQHELGDPRMSFLGLSYLAGKEGLMAGEKLSLDIKRMEMAYHDRNQREYEMVKHVSMRSVDPSALMDLRATGQCTVELPEALFDMDCPGHYFRRIKSVAVSIPCVTGPYTSVNCSVTLLRSSIRKSPLLSGQEYGRQSPDDDRFSDHFGSLQSIVTSSGQSDSGTFETNLRDQRFLPFEGSGVISKWSLQLPAAFRQFDYTTISDVILHVRYTAREGGALLRGKAVEHLKLGLENADTSGLALLLSLMHDFPGEWHRFVTATDEGNFTARVKREYFPYFTRHETITINAIELLVIGSAGVESTEAGPNLAAMGAALNGEEGAFELSLPAEGPLQDRDPQKQVFLLIEYSVAS